jgi:hypothetical protein
MEDVDQKEAKEESGKEDLDEKEDRKEGQINHSLAIILMHENIKNCYTNCAEKCPQSPYSEVISPPPDFV